MSPSANDLAGYPEFQFIDAGSDTHGVATVSFDLAGAAGAAAVTSQAETLASEAGLAIVGADQADWVIRFRPGSPDGLTPAADAAWREAAARDEGYLIQSRAANGRAETSVHAQTPRGVLYGFQSALGLYRPSVVAPTGVAFVEATVVDYPQVEHRGVIEGIYGRPFPMEDRAFLLRLMARVRENIYLYGPKNDPYARDRWREPYPNQPATAIATAATVARESLVRFIWSISPGLSFNFNDAAAEFTQIKDKIASVRELGVSEFALFLDDIPLDFGLNAAAHADLANRFQDELDHDLYFVGTTYHGGLFGGPNDYTDELGECLAPTIKVFWTGNAVHSGPMKADDMDRINTSLQRKVTIWDNWPSLMTVWFWMPGPVHRGSADLHLGIDGFLSSPAMNEFNIHPPETFWKVIGPLADYRWNPDRYDKDASYERWQEHLSRQVDAEGVIC